MEYERELLEEGEKTLRKYAVAGYKRLVESCWLLTIIGREGKGVKGESKASIDVCYVCIFARVCCRKMYETDCIFDWGFYKQTYF